MANAAAQAIDALGVAAAVAEELTDDPGRIDDTGNQRPPDSAGTDHNCADRGSAAPPGALDAPGLTRDPAGPQREPSRAPARNPRTPYVPSNPARPPDHLTRQAGSVRTEGQRQQ